MSVPWLRSCLWGHLAGLSISLLWLATDAPLWALVINGGIITFSYNRGVIRR